MKATIKNIHLENFGRHGEAVGGKNLDFELRHRTVITGSNGTGKSTVKRAIQYILGSRDENGKEITGIRPHDENGVDIDGLTTVAEMTLSVDGTENTLKRTCFQEKNRQGEYTGKDNLQYFVDDVKKGTKKSYEEFVQTIVPNMVCICANELLSKDTAGRRAMLEPFSKHTADDIISENPQFEPLRGKLKANSTADLKKACRDKIREKEKKRDEVIATIKVKEGSKKDIDLAELELHRNALNEQIAENKTKQEDISKEFEEQQKASDGILELKFELNDLQRKANEENNYKRSEIENKILQKKFLVGKTEKTISETENDISICEKRIEHQTKYLEELREQYTRTSKLEFDENTLICPYCGNEFKEDEKEKRRTEFKNKKVEDLSIITANGEHTKNSLIEGKQNLIRLNNELPEHKKNLEMLNNAIADLENQLSELTESIDISGCPEVQEIQRQIAEKEQAMNKGNSAKEIRQKLREEYEELQQQLNEIQKQFDKAEENNRIDERIKELRQKQHDLSQEIADIEKELDLLKLFERKKAELLESDINSNFNIIEWHMFKKMQNGDLADICSPFVNGTSYDGNLNFSDRLLAEIDICTTFQKLYDVQAPVLLDNCESISNNRLPNVANQLIMFRVPSIPEKPFVPYAITEEEEQKIAEQWQEEKKKFEEYYSELRIECLED